mmetsp:Transcript_25140/g.53402  ORF Transcript_25140/g.53402 Transcript_25140/m.53402 type:complete len:113 (+) Transcript_25140:357-695(+)
MSHSIWSCGSVGRNILFFTWTRFSIEAGWNRLLQVCRAAYWFDWFDFLWKVLRSGRCKLHSGQLCGIHKPERVHITYVPELIPRVIIFGVVVLKLTAHHGELVLCLSVQLEV